MDYKKLISTYPTRIGRKYLHITLPEQCYTEQCYVCHTLMKQYGASAKGYAWKSSIEKHERNYPYEIAYGKKLYVTCGEACKNVISINPLAYLETHENLST